MAGIARIIITDQTNGRGTWRFRDSQKLQPSADTLYRQVFATVGMPLAGGVEHIRCTKDEFEAGYDCAFGVDVILTLETGQQMTMQEKFLFTKYNTVTVEFHQDWRAGTQGDWFNLRCQYYFVGYDFPKTCRRFSNWILLDWSAVVKLTGRGAVGWRVRQNTRDGARADFKYATFDAFPSECIVARMGQLQHSLFGG